MTGTCSITSAIAIEVWLNMPPIIPEKQKCGINAAQYTVHKVIEGQIENRGTGQVKIHSGNHEKQAFGDRFWLSS